MPTHNDETLHDRYTSEHMDSIKMLKNRISEMRERLPYADGQAYYDDKRKIEALTAELQVLESASAAKQGEGVKDE